MLEKIHCDMANETSERLKITGFAKKQIRTERELEF